MDETLTPCKVQKQGGWRTFPYVIGGVSGVLMGTQGVTSNLLVYLIEQFNMRSIDATQIVSFVNGCSQLAPIVGAIVADAVGCFPILSASMAACFLSILLFMATAAIPSLSPAPCTLGVCEAPSGGQLAVLYLAITLLVVGVGGNRLNSSTFGAKQMDSGDEQATFFNWFTVAMYASLIVGTTALVYVEDNMGWVFGFGICAALCAVGLFMFHLGKNYYRHSECRENPFMTLLRSLVRRIGKKSPKSRERVDDYERLEDGTGETKLQTSTPSPCESSLVVDDERSTETEEEEVLRSIVGLLPLMASIICTSLACSIQGSLATLQAMAMDRHLGPGFSIPAASTPIFTMAAAVVCIPLLEGIVLRRWHVTPLQRIGASHLLTFVSLAGTAVVESRRLTSAPEGGAMSVLWMVPPLVLVGLGEALYFPAQLVFYFQEFPESLRSSSAGMTALMTGIGCYLSTTAITLIQRFTDWWRDDIDESRFDNVYWMLAAVVLLNFGYFLICAVRYKSKGKAKI
ncbi:protein NRT1/ PTR FAMILY 2.7-like isoform X1 [Iris pallida]|uniref:Protein NRT1/ PTR FAMILY 2.7-like isoform X1 n=1 Tax=Iris pallida TaxID=29817 RepID=A0AAX6HM02_IRIPA|nr:protein NRT1/ PTR FAMILY 2.7-like isoform X1 [Iris pallida]